MLAGHCLLRRVLSIPLLVLMPFVSYPGGIIPGCVNGLGMKFMGQESATLCASLEGKSMQGSNPCIPET